jgi:hypothetical protein
VLEPSGDVVAAVRKVERRRVEVALDQPEKVRLFRLLEELSGGTALNREDAEVGRAVDVAREDSGNLGALGDNDEVVGCARREKVSCERTVRKGLRTYT